jgi:hypothetical protein
VYLSYKFASLLHCISHLSDLTLVENLNLIEIIMERNIIERDEERKRMEARIFQVVRHSAYPNGLHLYYVLSLIFFG